MVSLQTLLQPNLIVLIQLTNLFPHSSLFIHYICFIFWINLHELLFDSWKNNFNVIWILVQTKKSKYKLYFCVVTALVLYMRGRKNNPWNDHPRHVVVFMRNKLNPVAQVGSRNILKQKPWSLCHNLTKLNCYKINFPIFNKKSCAIILQIFNKCFKQLNKEPGLEWMRMEITLYGTRLKHFQT